MTWKPIDFQGIISLDTPLVDQLNRYLQDKESQLGNCIVNAIHTLPRESLTPVLPFSTKGALKLSDAVDAFAKHIRQVIDSPKALVSSNDCEVAVRQINNCLWEYLEVLEGNVTELFQQLGQIGFEQWHQQLQKVVENIREILMHRMEELNWIISRLENLLWQYRWTLEARDGKWLFWRRSLFFWKSLLDRELRSYLKRSERYLSQKHQWFVGRYEDYLELKQRIEQSLQKFKRYTVFKTLDETTQENFIKIYRLIRLWELNEKLKSLPEREPIRALRSALSMDKATELFREYYNALENALFERSRFFKKEPNESFSDKLGKPKNLVIINVYSAESHTLGASIAKYREFYLRTHPNPYIRSRWGFTEWVVGTEPTHTKTLLHLVYGLEKLDELFQHLRDSLVKGPMAQDQFMLSNQYQEIQRTLHELGQPLTSRIVMRTKAERLLYQIQQMDELGSFNPLVVEYVEKIFSKSLRADWQYHVLFEFPLFHQLYDIHQGIVGPIEDRQHFSRMNKFKEILQELEQWVENRNTHRHVYEIEQDMTDIRGYLQDFLASVQRIPQDKAMNKITAYKKIREISKQLLQYRYTFGNFFHFLHQKEPEGKLIRNQFLFVDQYFETIESTLNELESAWS